MPTEFRKRSWRLQTAAEIWDTIQRIWFLGRYSPELRQERDARLMDQEIRRQGYHPRTAPRDVIRRVFQKVRNGEDQ